MTDKTETNIEGASELFVPGVATDILDLTAGIASAFVSNNSMRVSDVAELLTTIHGTLTKLNGGGEAVVEAVVETDVKSPAEIKKSIKPDALTSFIDGKPYKTLKRHLAKNGLTPEQYKTKFGLPSDYPTTSANYSAQRSALAKSLGLGQQRAAA